MVHFHGRLIVTVAADIILNEKLGQEGKEIEWRVQASCTDDCEPGQESLEVEVIEYVGGTFNVFLTFNGEYGLRPEPQIRQELYLVQLARVKTHLPESSRIWTRCTAQEIMKSVLSLPVRRMVSTTSGFGFSVNPNAKPQERKASCLKVLDIVKRSRLS
jgi:hypothetical protein